MAADQHRQFLRLTRFERATLLDRLDEDAIDVERRPRGERPHRREAYRWRYRLDDIAITVEHPAGGLSRYLVHTRNLSSGGMAFLHGGYIYPGSTCRILLPRFDGELPELAASVISCRYVDGIVHEVGVDFLNPIDPKLYLQSGRQRAMGPVDSGARPSLHGNVLYIEEVESARMLLAHGLRDTGIDLTTAASRQEALEQIASRPFDVVICDLLVEGRCSMELIRQIHDAQPDASIILLTAENDADRVARAVEAGVTHRMDKPYDATELFAVLYEIQRGARGKTGEQRFSTMQHEDGMVDIISNFVEYAKQLAGLLDEAATEGQINQVRDLCLTLKGSAAGVGFAFLSDAAHNLIESIDAACDLPSLDGQLKRVRQLCESLGLEGE